MRWNNNRCKKNFYLHFWWNFKFENFSFIAKFHHFFNILIVTDFFYDCGKKINFKWWSWWGILFVTLLLCDMSHGNMVTCHTPKNLQIQQNLIKNQINTVTQYTTNLENKSQFFFHFLLASIYLHLNFISILISLLHATQRDKKEFLLYDFKKNILIEASEKKAHSETEREIEREKRKNFHFQSALFFFAFRWNFFFLFFNSFSAATRFGISLPSSTFPRHSARSRRAHKLEITSERFTPRHNWKKVKHTIESEPRIQHWPTSSSFAQRPRFFSTSFFSFVVCLRLHDRNKLNAAAALRPTSLLEKFYFHALSSVSRWTLSFIRWLGSLFFSLIVRCCVDLLKFVSVHCVDLRFLAFLLSLFFSLSLPVINGENLCDWWTVEVLYWKLEKERWTFLLVFFFWPFILFLLFGSIFSVLMFSEAFVGWDWRIWIVFTDFLWLR